METGGCRGCWWERHGDGAEPCLRGAVVARPPIQRRGLSSILPSLPHPQLPGLAIPEALAGTPSCSGGPSGRRPSFLGSSSLVLELVLVGAGGLQPQEAAEDASGCALLPCLPGPGWIAISSLCRLERSNTEG